jgi:hypothetical protein
MRVETMTACCDLVEDKLPRGYLTVLARGN